jgi:hemolysin activation/secretion protein
MLEIQPEQRRVGAGCLIRQLQLGRSTSLSRQSEDFGRHPIQRAAMSLRYAHRLLLKCSLGLLLASAATDVLAQAVERHLPTAPPSTGTAILAPNAVPDEQDATPIGPPLRKLVLLGASEAVHEDPPDGLTFGEVEQLQNDRERMVLARLLGRYLGQPLSRKLIAQIEAEIARRYRKLNHPFVSLSTPEQEIGRGALQIRVIEFKAADVSVSGVGAAEARSIRARIGLKTGDSIDSQALARDLDWVNRYPFRTVQAVFAPGTAVGSSDLTVAARDERPWQVYGGYNNDGSPSTGLNRYFLGGSVGDLLGRDSVLSLQATDSHDVLQGKPDPQYQSTAISYVVPLGRLTVIEASTDVVETNQVGDPFSERLRVIEGALGLRAAVPAAYGLTDARMGVEAKRQTNTTFFGPLNAYQVSMDLYQVYVGLHHAVNDALGATSWEVTAHLSPGNIGPDNSDAQALLYSQGRLKGTSYGYLTYSLDHFTPLPLNLNLRTQIIGQVASGPLPLADQSGLGGAYLVRAYSLDDGAVDTSVVMRNELHGSDHAWANGARFNSYLFFDHGFGREKFLHKDINLSSVGVGAALHVASNLSIDLVGAEALSTTPEVRAGDWRAHVNLTVSF